MNLDNLILIIAIIIGATITYNVISNKKKKGKEIENGKYYVLEIKNTNIYSYFIALIGVYIMMTIVFISEESITNTNFLILTLVIVIFLLVSGFFYYHIKKEQIKFLKEKKLIMKKWIQSIR